MNTFNEMVEKIAAQIRSSNIIEIEDIPNIDLYMDQVTTFMDKCLAQYKRYDDDKVLTKTMINNYTKAKIFPAPIKKKYSRLFIILLITPLTLFMISFLFFMGYFLLYLLELISAPQAA